jgi:hypothetical protein
MKRNPLPFLLATTLLAIRAGSDFAQSTPGVASGTPTILSDDTP